MVLLAQLALRRSFRFITLVVIVPTDGFASQSRKIVTTSGSAVIGGVSLVPALIVDGSEYRVV